jgi:hypothetical protein
MHGATETRRSCSRWSQLPRRQTNAQRSPADEERAKKIAEERDNSFRSVCEDFFAEKLTKERKGQEVRREAPWCVLSSPTMSR